MWAALGGGGRGSLMKDVGSRSDMARRLLAVTAPVGTRLGIQARGSGMLVPLRHVLGWGRVWRILAVSRICRTRTRDGGIYRESAVRLGVLRLGMIAPVVQRHGRRTCWCLRHATAAPVRVGSGVV